MKSEFDDLKQKKSDLENVVED